MAVRSAALMRSVCLLLSAVALGAAAAAGSAPRQPEGRAEAAGAAATTAAPRLRGAPAAAAGAAAGSGAGVTEGDAVEEEQKKNSTAGIREADGARGGSAKAHNISEGAAAAGSAGGNGSSVSSASAPAPFSIEELRPCADQKECLGLVDAFLQRQPRQQAGAQSLLQAYDAPGEGGGGPCGALCDLKPRCVADRCRYYVYDNAVAAIYFTHRGNMSQAKVILESLKTLLYPAPRSLSLLYSAYAENGDVLDWSIDIGNNAWVGMAFVHYAAASGDACFAGVARDILHSLADQARCDDGLQGFMGRLPRGVGTYRATEHNIDMFALARMLGEQELQARAGRFVSQMYGFDAANPQTYATGTTGTRLCDTSKDGGSPVAADTQFWNLLADADPDPARKRTSLQYVLRPTSDGGLLAEDEDIIGDRARLLGVRFTTRGSGAQWENTASAVMGIGFYDAVYGDEGETVSQDLVGMRAALLHQLAEYGSVLASVRGGNYEAYVNGNPDPAFPGGSDTGLGWAYLRYPHLAATAWTGLMLLEANPFAPPGSGLPTAPADASCPAASAPSR